MLKSSLGLHSVSYNAVADDTGLSSFVIVVVASEIPRNSLKIRTCTVQGHPRSYLGANRKSISVRNFLL